MTGATHALIGAAVGLAAAAHVGATLPDAALIVGAAAFAALLPDLDEPGSIAGRRLWLLSYPVSWLTKHRGATHTILAWLLLTLALHWPTVPMILRIPVSLGYLSHLIADMATFSGLRVFWPVVRFKCYILPGPLRFTTGGAVEALLSLVLTCGLVWQIGVFSGVIRT